MTQLTKDQWKAITERLSGFHRTVDLMIDGYKVQLRLVRVGVFENAVAVYVNGSFKGKWFIGDDKCEELRRFFPCRETSKWPAKYQKTMTKLYGKRRAKEHGAFERVKRYSLYWRSFRNLKSHLIKNNNSIAWLNEAED